MLDQVVRVKDNRELVLDQALKHEISRELWDQSDVLVKNMETIRVKWTTIFTAKTEHSCVLILTTFKTKFLFLRQEQAGVYLANVPLEFLSHIESINN